MISWDSQHGDVRSWATDPIPSGRRSTDPDVQIGVGLLPGGEGPVPPWRSVIAPADIRSPPRCSRPRYFRKRFW